VISLKSEWFPDGGEMPVRCAGKGVGADISPPLGWDGVPDGTKELALIMEDSDAPLPRPFVHLIVYGIPGESLILALNRPVRFEAPPNLRSFLKAVSGTVVGRGRLTGRFERT
jgi:hypothetical protein